MGEYKYLYFLLRHGVLISSELLSRVPPSCAEACFLVQQKMFSYLLSYAYGPSLAGILGKKMLEHWFVACIKSESLTLWLLLASSCSLTIA